MSPESAKANERLFVGFFHAMRAEAKRERRGILASPNLIAAVEQRAAEQYREAVRIERAAIDHARERVWG